MGVGDAQYASVLDSRGLILDLCYVLKTKESLMLLLEGADFEQTFEYISGYATHSLRQGRLDVQLVRHDEKAVIEVVGGRDSLYELCADAFNSLDFRVAGHGSQSSGRGSSRPPPSVR